MNKFLSNLVLGIGLPTIITCILLSPIMLTPGIPAYGDEDYFGANVKSYMFNPSLILFSWVDGNGPSVNIGSIQYSPLYLAYFFKTEYVIKAYILFVASLAGILTFFAIKLILNEWRFTKHENLHALIASLFYLLVFMNPGLLGAATAPSWVYVTTPLSIVLAIKYMRKGSWKILFCLGILSLIGNAQPLWFYITGIAMVLYLILHFFAVREHSNKDVIKRASALIIVMFAFNAYFLLPSIAGYLAGSSGVFTTYTATQLISYNSLAFLSKWSILDVMMVGEHEYFYFWLHPMNYSSLNVVIPIFAVTMLLYYRKKFFVNFIGILLIVGLMLSKGVNPPGGYLYYLVARDLPYGAGAILRNPGKFAPLVVFPYAFLLGLFIAKFYEKLCSFKLKRHDMLYRRFRPVSIGVLVLLILSPITYGTLLDLQGYTWPRYSPTYVPQAYDKVNTWISSQEGDFKVMWIPSGGGYIWKPYIITAFPDLLSSRPAVDFQKIYPAPLNSTTNIGEILKMLGVKYVIYHGDSLDYPNDIILSELKKQNDLKQILVFNYTYYAENNSNAPLPIGKSIENIPLEFANIPFKLLNNSYILSRGAGTNLKLYYEIPSYIVSQGFSGTFSIGFSMRIEVFPAGSTDINSRIYEAFVSQQILINNTAGYVIFNVKIPENYPYTAVDVYANIYDGSFRPLSPLYYIGRFTINPAYVTIPFIVFENEAYEGQTYIESGNATIISYSHVNPVETEVVVNASTPFTLVFTEPYDKLWRAYVNGKEIEPRALYGMVNEFLINEKGILHIKIYYTLQIYLNLGWLITALSFIILIFLFINQLYINKLKLIRKKVTKF